MQDVFREDWHQYGVRRAEQAEETDECEQQTDRRGMEGVENPFVDKSPGRGGGSGDGRSPRGQPHGQEATDDRQIANAVNREAYSFSCMSDYRASQGRTKNTGAVDQSRIESDGTGEVL